MKKISLLLCFMLCLSFLLTACGGDDGKDKGEAVTTEKYEAIDISSLDIDEYITLGEYKDITIEYKETDGEKSDLLWKKILSGARVLKYPEQQVDYYYNQLKAKYIYIANSMDDTYENVLSYLGVTEESLKEEARHMTLDDLVSAAIQKAEDIELTENEKLENFDSYLKVFTETYGYNEQYVRDNLEEELYATMLRDKMMEKLVLLNNFVITD